jgi:hypothetical protein
VVILTLPPTNMWMCTTIIFEHLRMALIKLAKPEKNGPFLLVRHGRAHQKMPCKCPVPHTSENDYWNVTITTQILISDVMNSNKWRGKWIASWMSEFNCRNFILLVVEVNHLGLRSCHLFLCKVKNINRNDTFCTIWKIVLKNICFYTIFMRPLWGD